MIFCASTNVPAEQLCQAYSAGTLTPFTGAGISRPRCPDWLGFISKLEESADVGNESGTSSADLIRRASRAARVLRNRSPSALVDAVINAMYGSASEILPEATAALAEIWWPLVITTNYESFFLEAWNRRWVFEKQPNPDPLPRFAQMMPVGRGPVDCQRVLSAIRTPDNPLLWTLQGYIGRPGERHPLAIELTIGHEEYRRQTHEAIHFRRSFAEVYRSRTMLFLGSGLRESYLLDLFGEALELLGTIDHFHYALVPRGEVDPDFLQRRLQILAIEYDPHGAGGHSGAVAQFLVKLREMLDAPRPRTGSWTLKLDAAGRVGSTDRRPDISILRGRLRPSVRKTTAVAASAGIGRGGRLNIGRTATHLIERCGINPSDADLHLRQIESSHVYRLEGHPLYVVAARDKAQKGRDARDARVIAPTIEELLEAVTADGFDRVDTMLFASGRLRTFPQHFALHEMVRGYCCWADRRTKLGLPKTELRIFTVDPFLLGLLESRRLDLVSMAGISQIRFWVFVDAPPTNSAPSLAAALSRSTIGELAAEHAVPTSGWAVDLRPTPTRSFKPQPIEDLVGSSSPALADFGVLNGSTIIFSRSRSQS